jgi:hypothetical protein
VIFSCDFGGASYPISVADNVLLFRNGKRLTYTSAISSRHHSWTNCGISDQHPPGGPATYEVAMIGNGQAWYPDNPPVVKSDPVTVETAPPPPGACSVMLSFGLKSQVRRALQKQGKARISAIGTDCAGKTTNVQYTWERGGSHVDLGAVPVTLGDYYERIPAVLAVQKTMFASTKGATLTAAVTLDGVTVTRSISFNS